MRVTVFAVGCRKTPIRQGDKAMQFQQSFDRSAALEFGIPKRTARVDPAKSLDLIKRIRAASGLLPAPVATPLANSQTNLRAG